MTQYSPEQQQQWRPPQSQPEQPGSEQRMAPEPIVIRDDYRGSGKLTGKVALITGGDSGIGRSISVHFAREGADVAIIYLDEHDDAKETQRLVEAEGRQCLLLAGDLAEREFCEQSVRKTLDTFGRLNIVVNNAAQQFADQDFEDVTPEQVEHTFRTNIFPYFYLLKPALPSLENGGTIINTTSVTAYRGSGHLFDYSATKGAILALTRSMARAFADRGIRVNGVAPGPIWTPLIPATFSAEHVEKFGSNTLMKRAGQPSEVAPAYVFLACDDGSYFTGQVLHPNGGDVMM
ncbi:MAG TPA: SDR family oxidoreductase [Gammaproteobacteria bacterium]|nr:SDR family oxidoreductase [Gammaproteobacteria bacterium]